MAEHLTCIECGTDQVDFEDITDDGCTAVCEDCRSARELEDIVDLPDAEFAEMLAQIASPFRSWAQGEAQKLLQEADDARRRNDLDQARHLVRLCVHPKWSSEAECREAYEAAMAEKRGAVA